MLVPLTTHSPGRPLPSGPPACPASAAELPPLGILLHLGSGTDALGLLGQHHGAMASPAFPRASLAQRRLCS